MSGLSSTHQLFTRRGTPLLLAAGALGVALLAGCGGGGGNGNTGGGTTGTGTTGTTGTGNGTIVPLNADIIGKVTDVQGNGIPGVTIIPDSGGTAAVSLGQGGYRLNNLSGNAVHRITASVQQGGTQYTGSTEVLTQSGFLVSNANIVLSPATRQASVSGTVLNTSGGPLPGVQVSLALPSGSAASAGNFSSLIAFTDANGAYTIPNIPSDAPSGGPVTITASIPKGQNQTATLGAFQPGGIYNQNFTLAASTGQALAVPAILSVTTATEPTDSQSGRAIQAHAAGSPAAVYDQIRRRLSPAYARTAGRTASAGKRRVAHAVSADYAIETDLAFDPPASGSILGYNIYRTEGTTATTGILPTESLQVYDQLLDPLANYYTDVTFSTNTSTTAAGSQYNFALSALNTDSQETPLSAILSITPLGPLTLTKPTQGQTFTLSATLTWGAASGAQRYVVLVYDQYPTVSTSPVYTSPTPLAAGTTTATVTGLPTGHDYYAVVVGEADPVETLLPSPTSSTAVTNGALTFSQITRFHIQ